MTFVVRRSYSLLAVLAALALAAALALGAAHSESASASPDGATAAKLKRCKPGGSKKKCRCPKAKRRVKSDGRYRCKKKAPANTNPDPNANPGPNTDPPPAAPQTQRDDAAFSAALSGTLLRKYEEGSYGYGRYAYNFLPDGQLLYCSYYYAGGTVEDNRVGTWEVVEGHTAPAYPGYTIGAVRIVGSDFDVRIGIEMYNSQSNVETGNASSVFTEGAFSRTAGGAVTNCSAVE